MYSSMDIPDKPSGLKDGVVAYAALPIFVFTL
jgi:hypothetical protein